MKSKDTKIQTVLNENAKLNENENTPIFFPGGEKQSSSPIHGVRSLLGHEMETLPRLQVQEHVSVLMVQKTDPFSKQRAGWSVRSSTSMQRRNEKVQVQHNITYEHSEHILNTHIINLYYRRKQKIC